MTDTRDLARIDRDCALAMKGAPTDILAMGARLAMMYGLDPLLKHVIYLPKSNGVYPTVAGLRAYAEARGGLGGIRYSALTPAEREGLYPDLPKGSIVVSCTVTRNGCEYTEYGMCSASEKPDLNHRSAMARTRALGRALRIAYPINQTAAEEIEANDFSDPDDAPRAMVQVQAEAPKAKPTLWDDCKAAWDARANPNPDESMVSLLLATAKALNVPLGTGNMQRDVAAMTGYSIAPAFLAHFKGLCSASGTEDDESHDNEPPKAKASPWESYIASGGGSDIAYAALVSMGKTVRDESDLADAFNAAAEADKLALWEALKSARKAVASNG